MWHWLLLGLFKTIVLSQLNFDQLNNKILQVIIFSSFTIAQTISNAYALFQ